MPKTSFKTKADCVRLEIPADAWALLCETLRQDSASSMFDPELRKEIADALEQVREVRQFKKEPTPVGLSTSKIADVSTGHITENDGKLIADPNTPGSVALVTGDYGTIFYLARSETDAQLQDQEMTAAGLSSAFLEVIRLARANGCSYVRFDADGQFYDDLPKFEW